MIKIIMEDGNIKKLFLLKKLKIILINYEIFKIF